MPGLPMTVLPAGNENLLARYFAMGTAAERSVAAWRRGVVLRATQAGQAGTHFSGHGRLRFRCGGGPSGAPHGTGHVSSGSYFQPLLASIRDYDYPGIRVYWEGWPGAEGEVRRRSFVHWLFAFNLPCYGGGLQIAPEADGSDGLLDVCTFRQGGLWHGLYYTAAVLTGTHAGRLTARRAAAAGHVGGKVPYQLDGDPGGFLPVEIESLPNRLTLVVPARERCELNPVTIGPYRCGRGQPLLVIAGPCVSRTRS